MASKRTSGGVEGQGNKCVNEEPDKAEVEVTAFEEVEDTEEGEETEEVAPINLIASTFFSWFDSYPSSIVFVFAFVLVVVVVVVVVVVAFAVAVAVVAVVTFTIPFLPISPAASFFSACAPAL